MKKWMALMLALALTGSLAACGQKGETAQEEQSDPDSGAVKINLSDSGVTVDGETASTDSTAAVYTAHDIIFYLEDQDITYGAGSAEDGHSQEEADAHTVVHITQPGTYELSGTLSAGQIAVDLGEDAAEDPSAVVTLVLNGVDITSTVAPAVIFYNVYECGSADTENATKDVDTTDAGANVIIADGTVNQINGSYVAKIYRPDSVVLSADGSEVAEAKKLHKYDGAFYSKMSMNVNGGEDGTGVLNITAENEGLDSELHLTVNGGNIIICSGDDGINTNEDGVSVTTINGGTLDIQVDGNGEGDGIDSNGWLVINGGIVNAAACASSPDSGLDSDNGIYINGGVVMASGNMLDEIEDGGQPYVVFGFSQRISGGTTITMKDSSGAVVGEWTPANDFTYLVVSSPELTEGDYTLWSDGVHLSGTAGMGGGMGGSRPDGAPEKDMTPPEAPDGAEPPEDRKNGQDDRPGEPPADGQQPPQNADGESSRPPEAPGEPPAGGSREDAGSAERSTVFSLTETGGTFGNIAAAE